MLELEKLLWKKSKTYRPISEQEKKAAHAFFEDWRDRFVTLNAINIRQIRQMSDRNLDVNNIVAFSADWSNAAIHVLTIPSETVQDWFLRSPITEKNKIVQAVLRDGGITNSRGTFIELPPL